MNKLTIIAASCLFSLIAPSIARAEWVEVYRDSSTAIDVQSDSVDIKGEAVAYYSRSRLKASLGGAKTLLIEGLINCREEAFYLSRVAGLNRTGEPIFGGDFDRQWRLIEPGTRQEAIANQLCQLSEP
jgi:hypothetical protein